MDEEHFELPVPPGLPLPPPDRDVLFIRHRAEDAQEGREHEDIMLRRVPRETAQRYRAAAGARGLTHAQYLAALVTLHERMRAAADGGDAQTRAALEELGLGTVSI